MSKTGYVNGSDMLLYIGNKAIGHCTSHTTTFNSETRERAVKPLASVTEISDGLWKEKSVVGLSVSISFDGLVFYNETEGGYQSITAEWAKGQTVTAKCMERGSTAPYLTGTFVIDNLERTDKAGEDAEYKGSLSNSGKVTIDETKLTEGESA